MLSKHSELHSPHGENVQEGEAGSGTEWGATVASAGARKTSGGVGVDARKPRLQDLPPVIDTEDSLRHEVLQDQEPIGGLSEESQNARAAVSPPMAPQQPCNKYQHSYSPYLGSGGSYRGVSPTLIHNYPGKTEEQNHNLAFRYQKNKQLRGVFLLLPHLK